MRPWLWGLAALTALALGLSLADGLAARAGPGRKTVGFERLTHGLGLGDQAAPVWDFSTFDLRLEPDCACALWPIPGGYLFSPEHCLTVWDPPETASLPRAAEGAP